jgi:hypothetical protein
VSLIAVAFLSIKSHLSLLLFFGFGKDWQIKMKFLSILLCLIATPLALAEEVVFNCKFQRVNKNVWFDQVGNLGDLGPGTPVRENVYMVSNEMLFTMYQKDEWILTLDHCEESQDAYLCQSTVEDEEMISESYWSLDRKTQTYVYSQTKTYEPSSSFRQSMEKKIPGFVGNSYELTGVCEEGISRENFEANINDR